MSNEQHPIDKFITKVLGPLKPQSSIEAMIIAAIVAILLAVAIPAMRGGIAPETKGPWTVECHPSTGLPAITKLSKVKDYSPITGIELESGRLRVFPATGCSAYRENE